MTAQSHPSKSPFFAPRRSSYGGGGSSGSSDRNKTSLPLKSPFLAPRRSSSYGGGSVSDKTPSPHTKNNAVSSKNINTEVEPEHKSTLIGCTANLITAIVGAGIVGIPYAMRETGLVAGWVLILISGIFGCKSLLLLVEMAKHVDAASYEILTETVFGQTGWVVCNVMMFVMSWGPMLSYLILVKQTLGKVLGYPGPICLVVSSLCIMLPISLQRDMADLARTSRISVLLNIGLVTIITMFSPSSESISDAGGFTNILSHSLFRPGTCFIGLGVISFAFSCQHSSLIIAGSLANPTRERWTTVSTVALTFVSVLAIIMGSAGYVGFLENTEGNILKNFPMPYEVDSKDLMSAKAANVGRGFLCCTMLFVYPLESFVARHVIMTNLFQGREAHEGNDHAVLDRWDRRVVTTIVLYLSVLIPALYCDDVGIVLAWTGTVAATTLTYIGPGILFIGVHGQEFLDLVESMWDYDNPSFLGQYLWYMLLMPVWCQIALMGDRGVARYYAKKEMMTPANEFRLGKIKHKREIIIKQKQRRSMDKLLVDDACESGVEVLSNKVSAELGLITPTAETNKSYGAVVLDNTNSNELRHEDAETAYDSGGEEDPQDNKQTSGGFAVAVAFIVFGTIAFVAGIYSIYTSG
ncbi:hypothetical protein ACHAXR_006369 [Thalassiosira sp. AJA248-18]